MSGPIVRSGASATFSSNWDSVFGKGKKASAKKAAPAKAAKKSPKKKTAKKKK